MAVYSPYSRLAPPIHAERGTTEDSQSEQRSFKYAILKGTVTKTAYLLLNKRLKSSLVKMNDDGFSNIKPHKCHNWTLEGKNKKQEKCRT